MAMQFTGWQTWGPFAIPHFISLIKASHDKPTPEMELVGLKDPALFHTTYNDIAITQTIFDTVSRPDQARILLTNASGGQRAITACWIRGKAVHKVGGDSGYNNDKHVNYEAIAKDGESKFELANDYICTLTQVNKLADYHWKLNKTKKHIYTISLPGVQSWFEPGEWYVLTIGSAGTAEYIDSTVECYSVRTSYNATGSMGTQVSFREVEENWKFDSNETARYIAAGGHSRTVQENVITIGAGNYSGYADYYCPGTSDDASVISNSIIDNPGKHIHLTDGHFMINSIIESTQSDVHISGNGAGTVLEKSSTSPLFYLHGYSSDYIENVVLENLKLSVSTSDSNAVNLVDIQYCYNANIDTNIVYDFPHRAFNMGGVLNSSFFGNTIDGNGRGQIGLQFSGSNCNIVNNNVGNLQSTQFTYGIIGGGSCVIANNHIHDFIGNSTNVEMIAIGYGGHDDILSCNYIENINTTMGSTNCYCIMVNNGQYNLTSNKIVNNDAVGIWLTTDAIQTKLSNNYCINNGSDTGVANTNQNNFLDQGIDTQVG